MRIRATLLWTLCVTSVALGQADSSDTVRYHGLVFVFDFWADSLRSRDTLADFAVDEEGFPHALPSNARQN